MGISIRIIPNEGLCLREPQDSKLGRKIIENSIILIDEIGFESFTFKKLAAEIKSTEASIYRYFENKHYLLLYLVSWYWEWVSHLVEMNTLNIDDPQKKLKIVLKSFVSASVENPDIDYVDEGKLHQLVISEGTKVYHTKDIDSENAKGFFLKYKELIGFVADIISEIDKDFKYPHDMATNLFEMSNNHIYFAKHLPRLTDVSSNKNNTKEIENMLNYFVERLLKL